MSDSGLDTLVFVYGTLKIGEPNHHWLTDARGRSSFLGPGLTLDTWPLVVVTEYNIPMLLGNNALILIKHEKYNHEMMLQIVRELGTRLRERFTKLIKKCWNILVSQLENTLCQA